jgi:hypothetical protein
MVPLHPRGRRWLKFLQSLDLDPAALPRPVPGPGPRDFIICGAPRTGTSLLAAMLFQPPRVITIMEPWAGMRLPPRELFRSLRDEIDSTGTLSNGKLDVRSLLERGAVEWVREGEVRFPIQAERDYLLGVKWPSFWRYLELLPETKFLVCLRHPYDVVESFKRTGGRLAEGQTYDVAFDRELNRELASSTHDLRTRRALMYEKIHAQMLPHLERSNVMAVRYEQWFVDPDELRNRIGSFLGTEMNAGPAIIRRPSNGKGLSAKERDLVAEVCVSARRLEYEL